MSSSRNAGLRTISAYSASEGFSCDDNALRLTLDVSRPEPALICAPSRSSRRAISSESSVVVPSSSIAIVNADVPGPRP